MRKVLAVKCYLHYSRPFNYSGDSWLKTQLITEIRTYFDTGGGEGWVVFVWERGGGDMTRRGWEQNIISFCAYRFSFSVAVLCACLHVRVFMRLFTYSALLRVCLCYYVPLSCHMCGILSCYIRLSCCISPRAHRRIDVSKYPSQTPYSEDKCSSYHVAFTATTTETGYIRAIDSKWVTCLLKAHSNKKHCKLVKWRITIYLANWHSVVNTKQLCRWGLSTTSRESRNMNYSYRSVELLLLVFATIRTNPLPQLTTVERRSPPNSFPLTMGERGSRTGDEGCNPVRVITRWYSLRTARGDLSAN